MDMRLCEKMNPFASEIIRQAICGVTIGGLLGFVIATLFVGGFRGIESNDELVTISLVTGATFAIGVLVGLVI